MTEENEKKQKTNYSNFPGNSKKEKEVSAEGTSEEEVKDEKVVRQVTSAGKIKKPPIGKRFVETFFGDDLHSVGQYVMFEVLLPALKNTVSEAISRGVDRAMFGNDSGGSRRTSYGSRTSYTNYSRYSSPSSSRDREERDRRPVSRRTRGENEEIILPNKDDADEILDQLVDLIDRFDIATVSDLKAMIGKTPGWTDEKNGWTDVEIKHAEIRRVREGWLLILPPAEYLD